MSVNPPEGTLTIENSHLDVKGNVSAVALKLGTLRLTPSYGLDAVANVSNSTTHTLELSNATTGLVTTSNVVVGKDLAVSGNATVSSNLTVSGNATVSSNLTVSGNATVTGDLNVSGALGILDAIYPVGTVIDRATAITDTHPNGKYKAFLAAPNQEWQEVDNSEFKVLEKLNATCDTTDLFGRATMQNVTAIQLLSHTFVEIGSTVTNYTPPVGTKSVTFAFHAAYEHVDHSPFPAFKLQVCEGTNNSSWNDIENSTVTYYGSGDYGRDNVSLVWTIDFGVGTSNDYNKGTIASTRPVFNMRWLGRTHDATVHRVWMHSGYKHTTDGSTGGGQAFSCPHISVTAIGTESTLKYKRTL
jgi:carbonic anhydrase/acetyltransferase-like protein (isoleucine patch superfamily)